MDLLRELKKKLGEKKPATFPVELYQYQRLPDTPGTSFIRLFELDHDHSDDNMLRGHLVHANLAGASKPSYDAVSYSWGRDILHGRLQDVGSFFKPDRFPRFEVERPSSTTGRPILCDGKTLYTQPNLYDFLVRMRQRKKRRPLWIDAICIQQDDEHNPAAKVEKRRQLEIMGQIYADADIVLVWLGESKHLSPLFPTYLDGLGEFDSCEYEPYMRENDILRKLEKDRAAVVALLGAFGIEAGSSRMATLAQMQKRNESTRAVLKVLGRDYFQRAWVV